MKAIYKENFYISDNKNIFQNNSAHNKSLFFNNYFIDDLDEDSKLFIRYVKKTQKILMNKFSLSIDMPELNFENFENFIRLLIFIYYSNISDNYKKTLLSNIKYFEFLNNNSPLDVLDILETEQVKSLIVKLFNGYTYINEKSIIENADIRIFLLMDKTSKNNSISFSQIVKKEYNKAFKHFIKIKSLSNPDIATDNFIKLALPETVNEAIFILKEILNWSFISLELIATDSYFGLSKNIDNETTNLLLKSQTNINILQNKVKELAYTLDAKEKIINEKNRIILEKEKQSIYAYKQKNDKDNIFSEKIEILKKDNLKLNKKYSDLLNKYNKLKHEFEIQNDYISKINKKDTIEEIKINHEEKYLFIVSEDITFNKKIEENFPNCHISENGKNLQFEKYKMVIFLTSHIGHSNYYYVKNQCQQKNIPFIHCDHSNIDLIKEKIKNNLKENN